MAYIIDNNNDSFTEKHKASLLYEAAEDHYDTNIGLSANDSKDTPSAAIKSFKSGSSKPESDMAFQ